MTAVSRTGEAAGAVHRAAAAVTTASGLIAAVLGCAFLAQGLTHATLDPVTSLVSELEARDQPDSGFFRAATLLSGVAGLVFAACLHRRLPPGRAGVAACWALALFALGSVVDAVWPLDCAPSADLRCRREEAAGVWSWLQQRHTWSGVVGLLAVLVSLALLGRHLTGRPAWRRVAAIGRVGAVGLGAYTAVVAAMILYFVPGMGLAQRVQVAAFAAWQAVLALARPEPDARTRTG